MAETRKIGAKEMFGGRLSGWWWFVDPAQGVRARIEIADGDDLTIAGENPFAGENETLAALSPQDRLERLEAYSAA